MSLKRPIGLMNFGKVILMLERSIRKLVWKDGFSPAPLTLLNQERWNDGDVQQVRKVWEGGI